jgi:hypothetical protein
MKYWICFLLLFAGFSILLADAVPPYVVPLYPTAGATGIPVNTDITFHIYDDVDGVNINSVIVNINGLNYTIFSEYFYYCGTPFDYIITINPPVNFQFGQIVNIQIDAEDLEDPPNIMPSYNYSFEMIEDLQPPYVGALDPPDGAINVPFDTDVEFNIYDSGIGVNLNSIVVNIQGVNYTHNSGNFSYTGTANNYHVIIDIPVNFSLGEVVEVSIDGADLNGMPMATFEYSFQIIEDVQPPYTGEWFPQPGSTGLPIDTNISFNIYDNIEGVDITSVNVNIQGITYTYLNTTFQYTTIPNGFSITIDPPYNFSYGEMVTVEIDAADLSQPPNQMSTFSFNFQCKFDDEPPYTGDYDPEPGQQDVAVETNIYFHIYDDDTGVDITTLHVDVNGTVYSVANGNLAYSGTVADYSITINPVSNFQYGEIVVVQVEAYDLASPANQLTNFSYSFQCIGDGASPYLGDFDPEQYSTNNPLNTNVSFHIYDDGFGVDISSVNVIIQGIEYSIGNGNLFYSGSLNDYLIIANPDQNFNSGDTVYVSIDAADLASPPHVMGTFNYSFECILEDSFPPFIWQPYPENGSTGVPVSTSISCYILDNESGVDSTSIIFKINDVPIDDYQIEPVIILGGSGYLISYQPAEPFQYEELVTVSISAADNALIPNILTEAVFTFECEDNQPPTIILPDSFSFEEDNILIENFSPYIFDPENDLPILEATVSNNIFISINGYMVTMQAAENWFGSETITFIIKDEEGNPLAMDVTDIIVTPVNDAPTFDLDILPRYISFRENDSYQIDFAEYIIDPEQQLSDLTLTITGNIQIVCEINDLEVTLTAPENWTGSEILIFTIDDNQGRLSSFVDITVTVLPLVPEEKVKVEPHTVTWSDSSCELIIYTLEEVGKIKCNIYNRRGKLIRSLPVQEYGENKRAFWNKCDSGSNPVSGGFYIYKISINNRIYQGSIIIAR